ERLLLALPLMLVAVAAVKGLAYAAQFTWTGQFGQRTVAWLRRGLLDALLRQSPVQLAQRMSGDLLSRFSADVAAVETAAIYAVGSWIRDGLQIAVLAGVAVALDWRLALIALAVVPVAGIPVARLTRSVLRRTREGQARLGGMAGQLREALAAVRTVQAYGAEEAEAARFRGRAEAHAAPLPRAPPARTAGPAGHARRCRGSPRCWRRSPWRRCWSGPAETSPWPRSGCFPSWPPSSCSTSRRRSWVALRNSPPRGPRRRSGSSRSWRRRPW